MSDIKKDHNIGSGTGAAAGAVTGAVIGTAVAGPVGSMVGAAIGGIVGSKAGDSIAEAVNPTEYEDHFRKNYSTTEYYKSDRDWNDYQPAYKYGYDTYGQHRGRDLDSVEPELERDWNTRRGESRLAWSDARSAVRDGWHHIERRAPGDLDRDGR